VLEGPEFEKPELLAQEKAMLGQYVTDHPLLAIKDQLARQVDRDLADVTEDQVTDGEVMTVAGIAAGVTRRYTRRGEPYALLRLEDLTGGVGVVAFPGVFDRVADLISQDRVLLVKGRADLRGRELQLVAMEISEPDVSGGPVPTSGRASDPLVVDVPAASCTAGLIRHLKGLFSLYRGSLPVIVQLIGEAEPTRLRLGAEFRVDGSAALLSELRRLLGHASVRLVQEPVEPASVAATPAPVASR
jgi:DNA polymerase-3 subunit alpha